jgi:hypothetical protein
LSYVKIDLFNYSPRLFCLFTFYESRDGSLTHMCFWNKLVSREVKNNATTKQEIKPK